MKYVKLSVIFKSNLQPPWFIGSLIRGAFGYALKRISCVNPSFKCDNCFAKSTCLYYEFYEEKNIYHKYRLDFELGKDFYDFSFFIFGSACEKLPYIVSAAYMMLRKIGLGKDRIKYDKFDMYINDKSCLENNNIKFPKDYILIFNSKEYCKNVKLIFITPLRIKKNNKFLRDDKIELKDIVGSIYQRKMNILEKGFAVFPYEICGNIVRKNIKYQELTRFSNRQKNIMNMGGIIGNIVIENLNQECFEILKLGEIIGVGKQTVFGLGKIKLEAV